MPRSTVHKNTRSHARKAAALKPNERTCANFYGDIHFGRGGPEGNGARYYIHPVSKRKVYIKRNGRIVKRCSDAVI